MANNTMETLFTILTDIPLAILNILFVFFFYFYAHLNNLKETCIL